MLRKILVVVLIIGLSFTTVGVVIYGGNFKKIKDAFSRDDDYTFSIKEEVNIVENLNINLKEGSVKLHVFNEAGYKVDFYESEYDKKTITYENNTLNIKQNSNNKINFFNFTFISKKISTVNVYLPETFNGKTTIKTTSGDITIENYSFSSLDLDVSSGNISLNKVLVDKEISVEATSGNIKINELEALDLYVKSTSGNLELENSNIKINTALKITSGNIKVEKTLTPIILINAVSGNVNLKHIDSNNINVDVTSGNVKVNIIGDISLYKIDAKVTSGNIYYQGDKIKGNLINPTGTKEIKLRSTSGNIHINFS